MWWFDRQESWEIWNVKILESVLLISHILESTHLPWRHCFSLRVRNTKVTIGFPPPKWGVMEREREQCQSFFCQFFLLATSKNVFTAIAIANVIASAQYPVSLPSQLSAEDWNGIFEITFHPILLIVMWILAVEMYVPSGDRSLKKGKYVPQSTWYCSVLGILFRTYKSRAWH